MRFFELQDPHFQKSLFEKFWRGRFNKNYVTLFQNAVSAEVQIVMLQQLVKTDFFIFFKRNYLKASLTPAVQSLMLPHILKRDIRSWDFDGFYIPALNEEVREHLIHNVESLREYRSPIRSEFLAAFFEKEKSPTLQIKMLSVMDWKDTRPDTFKEFYHFAKDDSVVTYLIENIASKILGV